MGSNLKHKFYEKAAALQMDNLYREAAANYLNAILVDRNSVECYLGLGLCYMNLNQTDKALKYFEIASELDKNCYDAFYQSALCYQKLGNNCGAIKNFIKAIQLKPDSTDAILQLGISHELCEEYDLALMIYEKLIENSPQFIKAYEHKSALLMKMDRFNEASSVLYKLNKINNYNNAYFGLGVCFEKLCNPLKALRYYRKFIDNVQISDKNNFVLSRIQKIRNKICVSNKLRLLAN